MVTNGREALDAAIGAVVDVFGARAVPDAPLGSLTTYRVGGPASLSVCLQSVDDLVKMRNALAAVAEPVPLLVVGQGSNLLVSDAGFEGIVVTLGHTFEWVEVDEKRVRAGGATRLPVLARRSAAAGLTGLEWAVGIPGSVGGALRMNAGGHGSDTAAVLSKYRSYDLCDGTDAEYDAALLAFGYRRSGLGPGEVVIWGEFVLSSEDPRVTKAAVDEVVRWRRANQPGGSNAGSVFTNPPDDSAGRLVEAAGLKGLRMASARVSEKHANFIQADEGGSADDVRRLLEHVRAEVSRHTGVSLETEVRLVGFADVAPTLIRVRPDAGPDRLPRVSPSMRG